MLDETADVVVVGSGAAGLIAACVAADAGRSVDVLEKSPLLGGSTAISGGMIWVPNNDQMPEGEHPDESLTYLMALTRGMGRPKMLQAFVDAAPVMLRYLKKTTGLSLYPVERPDYRPELPGGERQGRTLDPHPFRSQTLGPTEQVVRSHRHTLPITYRERREWGDPDNYDWPLIDSRISERVRTQGPALAAALVRACQERKVKFHLETRASKLLMENESVIGVRAVAGDLDIALTARCGVVLAAGGFEWDSDMIHAFQGQWEHLPVTPPWNTGDAIRMGLEVGAALGNMTESWWFPVFAIPGEEYDSRRMVRMLDERALPGSVMVNGNGRRFVNEATNYNDLGKALRVLDPNRNISANLPAWLVFDSRCKKRYTIATVGATTPAPEWFHSGRSIEELAAEIGISVPKLSETIARFNSCAERGTDLEFRRGETAHDLFQGDPSTGLPNPCLAPLLEPPFYAIEVKLGSLGTKGGLVTNEVGQVLRFSGEPIRGLFACGNTTASVMEDCYPGAGGTLGPALTFGFLCGQQLVQSGNGQRH